MDTATSLPLDPGQIDLLPLKSTDRPIGVIKRREGKKRLQIFTETTITSRLSSTLSAETMPAATSTSRANGRSSSAGTPKLLVVLKLSSSLLKKFAPVSDAKDKKKRNSVAGANNKKNESGADSPPKKEDVPSSPASSAIELAPPASSVDNASDAASTPVPGTSADANRKSVPGPKPGAKRSLNVASDTSLKPRGKPGPKKRPRLYVAIDPLFAFLYSEH